MPRTLQKQQLAIAAKLYKAGRAKGYDAIVLSPAGYTKFKAEGEYRCRLN
jgi:hypothetical protein